MRSNVIVEMILSGQLTEGSTLSERWVADYKSVSQVKAREFIKELSLFKIVEQKPQSGSMVCTFTDLQKQQVFAHRYQMESYSVDQLIAKLDLILPDQREAILRPLNDEMENMEKAGKARDFVAFTHSDMHFHSAIARIINFDLYVPWIENLFVSHFLTTESRIFFGNALLIKPETSELIFNERARILEEHFRIYHAILACDACEALRALGDHLTEAERHWKLALQRKGIIPATPDQHTCRPGAYLHFDSRTIGIESKFGDPSCIVPGPTD